MHMSPLQDLFLALAEVNLDEQLNILERYYKLLCVRHVY